MKDRLEQIVLVISLEGRLPSHHFVHEDTQGPPVHACAVIVFLNIYFLFQSWLFFILTRQIKERLEGCLNAPSKRLHVRFTTVGSKFKYLKNNLESLVVFNFLKFLTFLCCINPRETFIQKLRLTKIDFNYQTSFIINILT